MRGGAGRVEALIPIYYQLVLSSGTDLPGGWRADIEDIGCSRASITLTRTSSDKREQMWVARQIDATVLDRVLNCFGPSGVVYDVIIANSRYFAFYTAGPAWVFFDRQDGKFLPFTLRTEDNSPSNLFVDAQGQIYLDMSRLFPRGTASEAINLHNIFLVQLGGQPLVAPISHDDWDWVSRHNAYRGCLVAQYMGRPCEVGAPRVAPVPPGV